MVLSDYLPRASSFAGEIDDLILVIAVTTGFFFFLAQFIFFWLILRFSAKEGTKTQYVPGEAWREKRWVSIPHYTILVFDVIIIVMALRVWNNVKTAMPPTEETVRIVAQQWAWTFIHAGPDGKLDTPDDIRTLDELHVQLDRTYQFELTSKDVLHSFSVPVFRLKQDAVPGRVIRGWFKPTFSGGYDIQCTEICGIGHALMPARIIIDSAENHARWMQSQLPAELAAATPTPAPTPTAPAPTPTPAPEGAVPPAGTGGSK